MHRYGKVRQNTNNQNNVKDTDDNVSDYRKTLVTRSHCSHVVITHCWGPNKAELYILTQIKSYILGNTGEPQKKSTTVNTTKSI